MDLILVALLFTAPVPLLNSQIAFISSLLVVLGSYWGYAGLVKRGRFPFNGDRDYIQRLEDPYDVEGENHSKSAKEIFEEERRRIKRSGNLKVLLTTYQGFFSPLRLLGYLFLVVALLALVRRGIFDPFGFLLGLGVVPAAALVLSLLYVEDR
ncbi:MAG: hypothetical protein C6I00_03655 [Nitratiruptor sp.]|nr:hypothetical protein [Nitratiruptor sp.]NPA83877.1 hypothetical protein [Campylobacterota bacterium]